MTMPNLDYSFSSLRKTEKKDHLHINDLMKDKPDMKLTSIKVRRAAKINTGNYENTDVSIELEATVGEGDNYLDVYSTLVDQADLMLKTKIDNIELGKRDNASKAKRFGV